MTRRPHRQFTTCVAIAAAGVVAAGCGKTGDDSHPVASSLTGRWAMIHFEDPVTVDLTEKDRKLDGNGCCGGIDDLSQSLNCCAPVSGQFAGVQASFGFSFNLGAEPYDYTTDVYVSADRNRMAGSFSRTSTPVAWVRIDPSQPSLPLNHTTLQVGLDKLQGSYGLRLADNPPPGADFDPQRVYQFNIDGHFVYGELGPFWGGEMAWREADQTLVAGPVPATAPTLPTALSLHADGSTIVSVEATMPSGLRYHFQPMPTQP